jgi:predicted nuclease of predicted toxin-antitoxin system
MAARFLLDENVERQVCDRLDAYGHTTEYVPDIPALGIGTSDAEIAAYSNAHGCIILTFDDDFVLDHEQSAFHAVVLYEDATISARETADIAQAIVQAYPNSSEIGIEYGTHDWL